MDEDVRTVWCGNLTEEVTEEILYELFLQAGPLENVRIPKDKNGKQRCFGFVVFKHHTSVPYSISLFEGTYLFNRLLNLKPRNISNRQANNLVQSLFPVRQDISDPKNRFLTNSELAFTNVQVNNFVPQEFLEGVNNFRTASLRGQWNGNQNPNLVMKHSSHYDCDRNKYDDYRNHSSVKKHHSDRKRYEQRDYKETFKGEHQKQYHNRKRKR